jgi:hypothetical protein
MVGSLGAAIERLLEDGDAAAEEVRADIVRSVVS